ncbi:MAG: hypothetical protein J6J36_02980 [Clostridia bacterium]|nr:hypothetical protein [Clostridia bacterium]
MKVYIVTLTTLYDNGDTDYDIRDVFQDKEDADRELLKLYNDEVKENKYNIEIHDARIYNNGFHIECIENYSELVIIGKIEEKELK